MSHPRNSFELWRGPSRIDGAPIMAIVTIRSRNTKTGDVPQIMILRQDVAPHDAVEDGSDVSVCGDCPLRPSTARPIDAPVCYVRAWKAPRSVWASWSAGSVPSRATTDGARRYEALRARAAVVGLIRLGSYGDPAAVPVHVWQALRARLAPNTRIVGYTHRWGHGAEAYAPYLMASIESVRDRQTANAAGWRTFRVRSSTQPVGVGEAVCPASSEAGKGKTCADCRACDGSARGVRRADVVIVVH